MGVLLSSKMWPAWRNVSKKGGKPQVKKEPRRVLDDLDVDVDVLLVQGFIISHAIFENDWGKLVMPCGLKCPKFLAMINFMRGRKYSVL